jgi:hypothetical protein
MALLALIGLIVFSASLLPAQTVLGVTLIQGDSGHPIVTRVQARVGNGMSLASFLDIRERDEIIWAHSDPIPLRSGESHQKWQIHSIRDLNWVLRRTSSKIGLTVKRGTSYVESIAKYEVVAQTEMTPDGRIIIRRVGHWVLIGPTEVDSDGTPRKK